MIPGTHRRLHENEEIDVANLVRLWRGERDDSHAEAIVVGTAAVAIKTVGRTASLDGATAIAREWWEQRDSAALLRQCVTT